MRRVARSTYGRGDINILKLHLKHSGGGGHLYLLKQTPPWILGAKQFLNEGCCMCVPLKVLWSINLSCALLEETGWTQHNFKK